MRPLIFMLIGLTITYFSYHSGFKDAAEIEQYRVHNELVALQNKSHEQFKNCSQVITHNKLEAGLQ